MELMNRYDWSDRHNQSSLIIDDFQRDFQCCGSFNASKSWEIVRPMNVPLGAYPLSCCDIHRKYANSKIMWCNEQQVVQEVQVYNILVFVAKRQKSLVNHTLIQYQVCPNKVWLEKSKVVFAAKTASFMTSIIIFYKFKSNFN